MKKEIYKALKEHLKQKASYASVSLAAAIESRNSDTKSSAGDKHETGREMIQQVIDLCQAELDKANAILTLLNAIDPDQVHSKVAHGSLVTTNHGQYFISVGTGKLKVGDTEVICLSPASPIGTAFMGLRKGEKITFNDREYRIKEIS